MKRIIIISLLLLCFFVTAIYAASENETKINSIKGEKWWGAAVAMGSKMPLSGNINLIDLSKTNFNNQNVPLLVSSAGRYIWSDRPFALKVVNGEIFLYSDEGKLEPVVAGTSLRDAFLGASAKHFPSSGTLPDSLFFSMPQYNTWIELMYNQNQKDILNYAQNVLDNKFPVGVFMIDDNWQKYYGNFEFKPERFPDPKGMIEQLHRDGFKIMFWVCPFVSPDSPEFRELSKKGYLIKKKGTNLPAVMNWWNGFSASYDLSNPEAVAFFKEQLHNMQKEYGVDGFKFDAGDICFFDDKELEYYDPSATSVEMSENWAKIGLDFPFNEYRAGWKMGGQPLVQRLGDKGYSWYSLSLLIPDMINAGLLGYAYTCPDMIGGGEFSSFLNITPATIDQDLIVRSCQLHALMPMMQFSVAPWRILDEKHLAICRDFAVLHEKMGEYILQVAKQSAKSGEPILRNMEYMFPHQGFSECKDQFMLGDKYLVAPILTKENQRSVSLPKGTWKDDQGKTFRGPKVISIDAPIERLPYYVKIK